MQRQNKAVITNSASLLNAVVLYQFIKLLHFRSLLQSDLIEPRLKKHHWGYCGATARWIIWRFSFRHRKTRAVLQWTLMLWLHFLCTLHQLHSSIRIQLHKMLPLMSPLCWHVTIRFLGKYVWYKHKYTQH